MSLEEEYIEKLKERVAKKLEEEKYLDSMSENISLETIKRAFTEKRFTTKQIRESYKWSKSTLDRFCAEGMPYLKGSPNLFRISEIEEFLNTHKTMYRRAHSKI